jgi:hypothetical protein
MGDFCQFIAFDTVGADDAESVVARASSWMISHGFIEDAYSDSIWIQGYPPGPSWTKIVDEGRRWSLWRMSAPTPPPPAKVYDPKFDFPNIAPNGVEISSKRSVCDPGENWTEFKYWVCPSCRNEVDPGVDVGELCGPWFEGDQCNIACPSCAMTSPLQTWNLQPYWAFANAHLVFWNWPCLSEDFEHSIAKAVGVPNVRHILCKR